MSKVNTSAPVRIHRQTGLDFRVRKDDVECSMGDKSIMLKIDNEILRRHDFRNKFESIVTRLIL
jgi:hypothetical protein